MSRSEAIAGREDVSRFVVHLTRNDRGDFSNGRSARDNFLDIITDGKIRAYQPHCLFNKQLGKADERIEKAFRVACFTEVPLNQLHLLVRDIPGRYVKLESYGFCFSKDFLIKAGGQPALCINSYGGNNWLYDAVQRLYRTSIDHVSRDNDPLWRILPFINAMHERYDFTWEREWRVRGSLNFKLSDLVCVILPSDGAEDLKDACMKSGIAAVSPGWTYEQIVSELAKQQSATKFQWKKSRDVRSVCLSTWKAAHPPVAYRIGCSQTILIGDKLMKTSNSLRHTLALASMGDSEVQPAVFRPNSRLAKIEQPWPDRSSRAPRTPGRETLMHQTLASSLVAITIAVASLFATTDDAAAQRGWWPGFAIGAITGAVVAGAIVASRPPGYVVYPGYAQPVYGPGCYWTSQPVYDGAGHIVGYTGQPVQVCPGYAGPR